jgi:hypothetical protein
MKPVPAPKKKLFVHSDGVGIELAPSSQDDLEWMMVEGRRFGHFVDRTGNKCSYYLFVSKVYDLKEVAAYLDSYNDVEDAL